MTKRSALAVALVIGLIASGTGATLAVTGGSSGSNTRSISAAQYQDCVALKRQNKREERRLKKNNRREEKLAREGNMERKAYLRLHKSNRTEEKKFRASNRAEEKKCRKNN